VKGIARPPKQPRAIYQERQSPYHDNLNRGGATYQYKVCEANSTTVCLPAVATVVF
jgi:hypothetical protein